MTHDTDDDDDDDAVTCKVCGKRVSPLVAIYISNEDVWYCCLCLGDDAEVDDEDEVERTDAGKREAAVIAVARALRQSIRPVVTESGILYYIPEIVGENFFDAVDALYE